MYQLGDQIVYGIHGVCNIIDLEIRTIDRKKVEYFVLSPVSQPQTHYYVPTQNQTALAKLRPMVTKEQIEQILWEVSQSTPSWISDENQRKMRYRELTGCSNLSDMITMIRDLHLHRARQLELGKKFHMSDERFLRDSEKVLCAEFAMVLNIPVDQVQDYVVQMIRT